MSLWVFTIEINVSFFSAHSVCLALVSDWLEERTMAKPQIGGIFADVSSSRQKCHIV